MEYGQIHHVEYYVNDLASSNEFWSWFSPILGYKEFQKWEEGISYLHNNGTYIVFVQVLDKYLSHENNRQGNGLNHIAFMGGTDDQLNELVIQLEKRNIKILKRLESYLCFEDPNKFAIEIYAKEVVPMDNFS
ncbi:MAG: hypothetical protein HOP07_08000 [Bacteriovoracaceae bacterium]|nr:hypothetical protein [Bacteriovoracaceae bacterium]